jgi:hypothetical protein
MRESLCPGQYQSEKTFSMIVKGVKLMQTVRTDEEIVQCMVELTEGGYNCSQILMRLSLEQAGMENHGLVRAMSGLGIGCGFCDETCGVITGCVCILAFYSAKGADSEKESKKLLLMLEEYGDWFEKEIGKQYGGTRCIDITKGLAGTPDVRKICGELVFKGHKKVNEILHSYGLIQI